MKILQFTLLSSEEVKRGRHLFRAINSNFFSTDVNSGVSFIGQDGKEDIQSNIALTPGRKIFRTYLQELLDEKFLVRIYTKDNRAKWYSITPLGICQLIKSEEFFDGIKLRAPENYLVILTLLTFATQNVKQYKSLIFGKARFFVHNINFWDDVINMGMSIREGLPHVLSNIDFKNNKFSFYVTNGYDSENKISLARGSFNHERLDEHGNLIQDNLIQIHELNKESKHLNRNLNYDPLLLDEEQFHHYFASLLMCSLIYDYAIAIFDIGKINGFSSVGRGKNAIKKVIKEYSEYLVTLPEYFQRIITLFSNHVTKIVNEQANLMSAFSLTLR